MKKNLKMKSGPLAPTPVTASHRLEFSIDIISLILVRLPVKTLSRFRCVCKPWYSLISSPHFQNQHHLRSQQNPLLLLASREGRYNNLNRATKLHLSTHTSIETTLLNKFSVAIQDQWLNPVLIQSCRGLVCLLSGTRIFLCNPSTEEIIALPPPTSESSCCIGFGFAGQEFKVVRFFCTDYDYSPRCQVFTLGTRQWREAKSPPWFDEGWNGAPLLHGSLHLLPFWYRYPPCSKYEYRAAGDKFQPCDKYIAAFDLECEEYKEIQLPEYHYPVVDFDELNYMNLTELGGSLCLAFVVQWKLELWLLKDYHSGEWTKQYTIAPDQLGGRKIYRSDDSRYALGILGDGKLLMNLNGPHETTELVCYDPKSRSITMRMGGVCSAALYVESFFSLGSRIAVLWQDSDDHFKEALAFCLHHICRRRCSPMGALHHLGIGA